MTEKAWKARILSIGLFALTVASSPFVYADEPEWVDFNALYEAFLENNRSTLKMPQYGKRLLVSGVALRRSVSDSGNTLLIVTSESNGNEMAAMSAHDSKQVKKIKAFDEGDEFEAICELGPTAGGNRMSFGDCVFR